MHHLCILLFRGPAPAHSSPYNFKYWSMPDKKKLWWARNLLTWVILKYCGMVNFKLFKNIYRFFVWIKGRILKCKHYCCAQKFWPTQRRFLGFHLHTLQRIISQRSEKARIFVSVRLDFSPSQGKLFLKTMERINTDLPYDPTCPSVGWSVCQNHS